LQEPENFHYICLFALAWILNIHAQNFHYFINEVFELFSQDVSHNELCKMTSRLQTILKTLK